MVRTAKTDCSPYLLRERRALSEACLQIRAAHSKAIMPCGGCGLADICRSEPLVNAPAVRHGRRALPEIIRRTGAVTSAK